MAPDEELAARLEKVLEKRSLIRLRAQGASWVCFYRPFLVDLVPGSRRLKRSSDTIPPRNHKIVKLKDLRARREDVKAAKKSVFRNARG